MIKITRMLALSPICTVFTVLTVLTSANIKAAGDLPSTVGTVGNASVATGYESESEHEGFAIEWEDGNIYDFFQQVKNAVDFDLESIDFFGFSSSDSAASKDSSVNAHNFHRGQQTDVAVNTQIDSSNQTGSQKQEVQEVQEVQAEKEEDWRANRKWWQRGSPVL